MIFLINGEEIEEHATSSREKLSSVRERAIARSGSGLPAVEWEVRTTAGLYLDPYAAIEDLGIGPNTRLLLSLRASAGG